MTGVCLVTERLNLRPITIDDLEAVHNLHTLPETDAYNTLGIPENIEVTKLLIDDWITANNSKPVGSYVFAIEPAQEPQFIGLAALVLGKEKYKNAEVWYKIHPIYWNKGYASETLKKLIEFGFNILRLHRIEAGCAIGNIASIKVLEKAGMRREAHTRQLLPLKTGWSDNYGYAILSTD